jgi:hypothetical protein
MVSDTITLGGLYKKRRCELGLSIKEVESATSIRSAYLEAIEEGRGDQLLSLVYIQGFMRQYALFLGLDLSILEKEFAPSFAKEETLEGERKCDYGIGGLEMRPASTSSGKLKNQNLFWAAAFIGVFFSAFLLVKLLGIF